MNLKSSFLLASLLATPAIVHAAADDSAIVVAKGKKKDEAKCKHCDHAAKDCKCKHEEKTEAAPAPEATPAPTEATPAPAEVAPAAQP